MSDEGRDVADGADAIESAEGVLRRAGASVRTAYPLASLTSFRIGGPAALYVEPDRDQELDAVAEAVRVTAIPWTIIGKGSNLLVSDRGFAGLVIRLGKGYRWAARDGSRLRVGGAMPLPALSGVALSHTLAGLEFGVAIPASTGGAVRMNAGAHGRSMQDVLSVIDMYSVTRAERASVPVEAAGFAYRRSALPDGSVVVGATMTLSAGDPATIRAGMEEARAWRRATQPIAEPNCGSVFKNPPGDHAARLVEAAGAKGLCVGGATVAQKHANFIVAGPGATASDVRSLMQRVRERVDERFGVILEPEVQLVGDFDFESV